MAQNDGPTKRILYVLELLLANGPMTLAEVTEQCAFSRAAVWRALDTLRATGWVRMRLGDNAYTLRPAMLQKMSDTGMGLQPPEGVPALMADLEKQEQADVCLGGFDGDRFRIVESTNKQDYKTSNVSLIHEGLALAAQSILPKTKLVRVLRAYVETCPEPERRSIEDGSHAQRLRSINMRGNVSWNHGTGLAMPLAWEGQVFSLRFRSKAESALSVAALTEAIRTLNVL